MPMDLNRKLAIRKDFDDMINMTPDEMRTHFATSESDMVSIDPKLAAKLKKSSGRTLGKKALVLKEKQDWEEADYAFPAGPQGRVSNRRREGDAVLSRADEPRTRSATHRAYGHGR
jgi:hypothetical protein